MGVLEIVLITLPTTRTFAGPTVGPSPVEDADVLDDDASRLRTLGVSRLPGRAAEDKYCG